MAHFLSSRRLVYAKYLIGFILLGLSSSAAHAQGAVAPAFFDVEEVVVQPIDFGNDKITRACGLSQQELQDTLLKTLVAGGVPAFSSTDDRPPLFSRARINVVANIFSYNSQGLDCTSWLSLSAESRNTVHVPPVNMARNVSVVYWREGSLLTSDQAGHESLIKEAIVKLAAHLATQYKQDQPTPQH